MATVGDVWRVQVRTWCGSCGAGRSSEVEVRVLQVRVGRVLGMVRAQPDDRVMLGLFAEAHRGPFRQSTVRVA